MSAPTVEVTITDTGLVAHHACRHAESVYKSSRCALDYSVFKRLRNQYQLIVAARKAYPVLLFHSHVFIRQSSGHVEHRK